jgi:polar amino acid transport system permease protein
MSRGLLMRRIILPQAFRIIVPSIGNFFVSIFKDSALVSVITMRDLMFSGQLLASATYKHFEIFAEVAVIYFLISYPTAKFVEWVEVKVDITKRPLVIGMRG